MKLLLLSWIISHSYIYGKEGLSAVTVKGKCQKKIISDRASIQINIEMLAKNLDKVYKSVQKKYDNFLKRVKKLGFKKGELQTTSIYVRRQYDWVKGKKKFRNFKASISLNVDSSNSLSISKVIDIAAKMKIDSVGELKQYVSSKKMEKQRKSCLSIAVKDAKEKALVMAQALNRSLGKGVSLQEVASSNPVKIPHNYGMERKLTISKSRNSGPLIQLAQIELDVYVNGVFELN